MSGSGYAITEQPSRQIPARVIGEVSNPFVRAQANHLAAGTVAIESERAIAEAQGKLVLAKRFPRDEAMAFAKVMESCKRPGLAAVAIYGFPRGGQTVSGPSIRLAEELIRCYGNADYGIRELSRKQGESEMEAYAWDLETNVMSSQRFTTRHIRDTKGGGKDLTDERDIYELTANMGARRLRARILAILPPDLVDAAVQECRKTREGGNKLPMADQVRGMTEAFAKLGVTGEMIVARLGHPLDGTTPDELADLRDIYPSIKDGLTKVGDWFGAKVETQAEKPSSKLDALEVIIPPVADGAPAASAPIAVAVNAARRGFAGGGGR